MVKKLLELLMKKNCRKKEINYMSNGKAMIIHLIAGLVQKT